MAQQTIFKGYSMKDIEIRELFRNTEAYADKEVTVGGWVRGNRSSNQFGFLSVNDGSFFTPVQVVYEADKLANFTEVSKFRLSAGVRVTAHWCRHQTPSSLSRSRQRR